MKWFAQASLSLPLAVMAAIFALTGPAASATVPTKVRFNEHVRPILSNCFYCHGPDEKHREADLRLDVRDSATEDRGGYAAIVPGKPAESMLLERIVSRDPDAMMPPPHSKKPPLTDEQAAILRKWIEQGAEYEGHWAFLPLAKSSPPQVKDSNWVRNPIDQFILARLEAEGIRPSPEADRATLIRRVSLDLTGLLPKPEEVEAFIHDKEPRAYERLVEGLLNSPHYGERWGRHWLDQARYADSNGYSIDSERAMWPYRDWVIKAFNDDMPFDQFTIEQLAGDLLPNPSNNQLVATAFHRNTLINEEGGVDREQFRHEAVVDRVNTTSAVWLGLTAGCAQCHTHKFDPITHQEYYQLFAFFNQSTDVNNKGATLRVVRGEVFGSPVTVPAPPPVDDQLAKRQAAWEKAQLALLDAEGSQPVEWKPAKYVEYDTKSGAGLQLLDDNSLLSDKGGAPDEAYRLVVQTDLKQIAAVRLRVLTHESLPAQGPGRANNGNFVLTDFNLLASGAEQPFSAAIADHEQPGFPASSAVDSDPKTGWAINVAKGSTVKMNANHEAAFVLEKPIAVAGQPLEIKLLHDLNENYLIGRFAIDLAEIQPGKPTVMDKTVIAALRKPDEKRTAAEKKTVKDAFVKADPKASAPAKKQASPDVADLMIMKEGETPRETFIYLRGDFLRPDKEFGPLSPGVLSAVGPSLPKTDQPTRLDLARWLVSPENALTPRVTMNRLWMRYFGRGLVETDEDFGAQGSVPSHPELLDWLAAEFIRQGWSQKAMHRRIVNSATYRQSSNARPDLAVKDPRNMLLARQERVRVEAEIVRDAALAASGLLDRTIGGPSVRPPQPEGVYAFTQTKKAWVAATGPSRYRRAMYTAFFRSAPYPLFTTFDAPDFQTACTRRGRSNTPLQALTVANDAAFLEIAQGLAARVLRDLPQGDVQARLKHAFELCLCREPSSHELSLLEDYFGRQMADFAKDQARAKLLLTPDLAKSGATADTAAAMVCVSRAILNTDAFITRP